MLCAEKYIFISLYMNNIITETKLNEIYKHALLLISTFGPGWGSRCLGGVGHCPSP